MHTCRCSPQSTKAEEEQQDGCLEMLHRLPKAEPKEQRPVGDVCAELLTREDDVGDGRGPPAGKGTKHTRA